MVTPTLVWDGYVTKCVTMLDPRAHYRPVGRSITAPPSAFRSVWFLKTRICGQNATTVVFLPHSFRGMLFLGGFRVSGAFVQGRQVVSGWDRQTTRPGAPERISGDCR